MSCCYVAISNKLAFVIQHNWAASIFPVLYIEDGSVNEPRQSNGGDIYGDLNMEAQFMSDSAREDI